MVNGCEYDDKQEKGMTEDEAKAWLAKLKEEAPEETRDAIGPVEVRALKNDQFMFRVGKEQLWEHFGTLKEVLKNDANASATEETAATSKYRLKGKEVTLAH